MPASRAILTCAPEDLSNNWKQEAVIGGSLV